MTGRLLDAGVVTSCVAHALAVAVLCAVRPGAGKSRLAGRGLPYAVVAAGAAVAWWITGDAVAAMLVGAPCVLTAAWGAARRTDLRRSGATAWVTFLWYTGFGSLWMVRFITGVPVSAVTRTLLLIPLTFGLAVVPSVLLQAWLGWGVLIRVRWRRPGARATPVRAWGGRPAERVSILVPIHAEPPDLVNATLDALSRLDHPNFEVLVIDNNTTDPALWEPVREHCERLGPRFRFHHVEGLTGAKAGALNWALPHTDPAAELIAVVDADYHAEPWFLAATVGYFDDPAMGFVQAPHDYRDWRHSRYRTACFWEYAAFTYTTMVTLDEHGAGLCVGTMSLIRRQALVDAGGWSPRCLTEDTEFAIRVHAAGYRSVYLTESLGRGLIPATFAAYRRQRFRWTYGAVQEMKEHARLLLFGGRGSQLSLTQRICHTNHGVSRGLPVFNLLLVPLSLATLASVVWHHEQIPVPAPLILGSILLSATTLAMRWTAFTRVLGASARETVLGIIGNAALGHVISAASLSALLGRPTLWMRTAKFRQARHLPSALRSVAVEIGVAATLLVAAAVAGTMVDQPAMSWFLAAGFLVQAAGYLCAPALVLMSERELDPARRVRGPAAAAAVRS